MIAGPIVEISVWVLKAAAIPMLARIAYVDFLTLRTRNDHVLALFAVALAIRIFDFVQSNDIARAGILFAASALVSILLVVFWMLRKSEPATSISLPSCRCWWASTATSPSSSPSSS